MKIDFIYDEEKDIDCLLAKGAGSTNQPENQTEAYKALLTYTNDITDREKIREFVRDFRDKNITNNLREIQSNWDKISGGYGKRAEDVFGIRIPDTIRGYLTITGRYPYSIEDKYFYVPASGTNMNKTAMHELWHFYTWYKFGDQMNLIGPNKYNKRWNETRKIDAVWEYCVNI